MEKNPYYVQLFMSADILSLFSLFRKTWMHNNDERKREIIKISPQTVSDLSCSILRDSRITVKLRPAKQQQKRKKE
jgi:hypothetical protein